MSRNRDQRVELTDEDLRRIPDGRPAAQQAELSEEDLAALRGAGFGFVPFIDPVAPNAGYATVEGDDEQGRTAEFNKPERSWP